MSTVCYSTFVCTETQLHLPSLKYISKLPSQFINVFLKGYPLEANTETRVCIITTKSQSPAVVKSNMFLKGYPLEAKTAPKNCN